MDEEKKRSTEAVEEEGGTISIAAMFNLEGFPRQERRQSPNGEGAEVKTLAMLKWDRSICEGKWGR